MPHSGSQWIVAFTLVGSLSAPSVPAADEQDGAAGPVDTGLRASEVEPGDLAPADQLLASVDDSRLRDLIGEVLERNPNVAALRARGRSVRHRSTQARSLPDPRAGLTSFVSSPETRVGPQRFSASLSQTLPWFGKRGLRERSLLQAADVLEAAVESTRLELLSETRRLYHEIAFLDASEQIVAADQATLEHYEELARARYASGVGLDQVVIKIQAEITRAATRRLDIARRRARLVAVLNALRDRPQDTSVPELFQPSLLQIGLDGQALRAQALRRHPEIARADAEIARAESLIDLARKDDRPDVTLALSYTNVGPRTDPGGQALSDNGNDIFGVSASINLPIRRKRLRAGVEEASERRLSAVEQKRSAIAAIDGALGDLVQRASLTWQQLRLLEDVLVVQAEESLASAESAYSAGTLGGLDLLDAERVLLDVRTSIERARADYAISLSRLEGTTGTPLSNPGTKGDVSS